MPTKLLRVDSCVHMSKHYMDVRALGLQDCFFSIDPSNLMKVPDKQMTTPAEMIT